MSMTDGRVPGLRRMDARLACVAARGVRCGLALAVVALVASGCGVVQALRGPSAAFDPAQAPPAPDYAQPATWLVLPGDGGQSRATVPGQTAVDEAEAPADVFFIHPTTLEGREVWNAPWDLADADAPLNAAVVRLQTSVFNGCCRIYAPRYRQASLAGLEDNAVMALAYADVAAAFRHYLARHNDGRPFIIASQSQGTSHATRLLQEEVLDTPLRSQLVAAYLIGGYVPETFPTLGLPICDRAAQTGCVLAFNANQQGRRIARRLLIDDRTYWWRGAPERAAAAVCVNPLSWRHDTVDVAARDNPGSLPFATGPFPARATALPATTPHLTGARCHDGVLDVEVPRDAPAGFRDRLSWMTGSYHLNDYGLFYGALRDNAQARVAAWHEAVDHGRAGRRDPAGEAGAAATSPSR